MYSKKFAVFCENCLLKTENRFLRKEKHKKRLKRKEARQA
jgi:hypothetical protein